MKNYTKAIAAVVILAAGWAIGMAANRETRIVENIHFVRSFTEEHLTARQRAWLGALEWCESRGDGTAVNWADRDGTPSFYWFQFKPATFKAYGEKYGLIPTGLTLGGTMLEMESYATTQKIVVTMISDTDVKWSQEFPACVKKLGTPPKD